MKAGNARFFNCVMHVTTEPQVTKKKGMQRLLVMTIMQTQLCAGYTCGPTAHLTDDLFLLTAGAKPLSKTHGQRKEATNAYNERVAKSTKRRIEKEYPSLSLEQ